MATETVMDGIMAQIDDISAKVEDIKAERDAALLLVDTARVMLALPIDAELKVSSLRVLLDKR